MHDARRTRGSGSVSRTGSSEPGRTRPYAAKLSYVPGEGPARPRSVRSLKTGL